MNPEDITAADVEDMTPEEIAALRQRFGEQVEANIAKHGVHITTVFDDNTCWSYTVGLARRGHEELLITGLVQPDAEIILNAIADMVLSAGAALRAGDRFRLSPDSGEVLLLEVEDEVARPLCLQAWFYRAPGIPIHVLQVVYPDTEDRMPWDEGVHPDFAYYQTIYGRRTL